jgi:hypothetical protein
VLRTHNLAASNRRVAICLAFALVVTLATGIASFGTASAAQQDPLLVDVAGKWYLTFDSAMGPMNWVAVFEQEGDTFSGTCDIGMGQYPVTEGRIAEKKISFIVELDMPGHEMLLSFEGTVEGDEAKGILTGMGDDQEWTGTRKK